MRSSSLVVPAAAFAFAPLALLALLVLASCGGPGRGFGDTTPGDATAETGDTAADTVVMMCNSNADCDDHVACTVDSCRADHTCLHTPINSMCPMGQTCTPTGCSTAATTCTTDADCDDHIDCTVDTCDAMHMCVHTAINGRCMPGQMCFPAMGCVAVTPCSSNADCMGHPYCDGPYTCMGEMGCVQTMPGGINCDDMNPCTIDACNNMTMMCTHMPNPTCSMGRSGNYSVTPNPMYMCTAPDPFGGPDMTVVDLLVTQMTVSITSTGMTVTCSNTSGGVHGAPPPMMGSPPAADGSFSVTGIRSGGCNENYMMTGRFTSSTMVMGTLSVSFTGTDCGFTNCSAHMWMFSGTLM